MASPPREALSEDFRAGKLVIPVDDQDRADAGDLLLAADACLPAAISCMVREVHGLVRLTRAEEHCRQRNPMRMVGDNGKGQGARGRLAKDLEYHNIELHLNPRHTGSLEQVKASFFGR